MGLNSPNEAYAIKEISHAFLKIDGDILKVCLWEFSRHIADGVTTVKTSSKINTNFTVDPYGVS